MLISLFRYIQGYLRVRITGYSPERFLNLCKNKKIAIWGLEAEHNAYIMYMKISGFRKLKPIIKKTKTKVVIEERVGLPFFFYRYRKRNLFFVGSILCLLLIYGLTFFVWNIELQGNQSITDNVLMEYLKTQDISYGMLKHSVNCEKLVKSLRKDFDDIIWVSVSMDGTKLSVRIKENTDTFEIPTVEETPSDIVAEQSGIVKQIITREGVPLVKIGDEVSTGDVLISGTVDLMNDAKEVVSQKYVVADGDITLESYIQYEDEISSSYQCKEYTGKKRTLPYLKLGNFILCIGWKPKHYQYFDKQTKEQQLKISENFYLPIWIGQMTYKEYKYENNKYSSKEMKEVLNNRFHKFCKDLEKNNAQILEKNIVIIEKNKKAYANCTVVIQQEVGISRKIVAF